METKEVFCGLIFNKDKWSIYNPREQNRVAWPEFLFLQIESWSFEVLPSFFLDTPPVPNYSMLHFSTTIMVIKYIYLCFCIGETVNLQLDLVHSSLKPDKFMLAGIQFFHLAQFKQILLQIISLGFLIQILTSEERTCYLPLIFSEK